MPATIDFHYTLSDASLECTLRNKLVVYYKSYNDK